MTKQEQQAQLTLDTADENSNYLKLAFLAAIIELRSNLVDLAALETAITNRGIEDIIRATQVEELDNLLFGIGMDQDSLIFIPQMQRIYNIGAQTAALDLSPEMQRLLSYDSISERAVKFLHEDGAKMVREITLNTKVGIQATIVRSLAEGTNPLEQAKEIRQLIGLTENQAQAVLNFKRQLQTRQNLGFTPPDERRLDIIEQTLIRRHMKEGLFTNDQIDTMVEKYFESLINKRALDIANTESTNAMNNGAQELWNQGLDQGILSDNIHRKFWVDMGDRKVRPTHRVIAGMNPGGVKIRSQFVTPWGLANGPGDRNVNLINCRCILVLGEYTTM